MFFFLHWSFFSSLCAIYFFLNFFFFLKKCYICTSRILHKRCHQVRRLPGHLCVECFTISFVVCQLKKKIRKNNVCLVRTPILLSRWDFWVENFGWKFHEFLSAIFQIIWKKIMCTKRLNVRICLIFTNATKNVQSYIKL